MPAPHRILAGVANQTLEHYPSRQVASATWELQDLTFTESREDRVIASGSATLDTFSQASSALAGPETANARRITLGSTAGLTIGRRYEIVSTDGSSEVFELAGINAGTAAVTKWPLHGSYPTNSTVRGLRLVTGTLPDTVYDDVNLLKQDRPLRVVWTYSTGQIVWEQAELGRNTTGDLDRSAVGLKVRAIWADCNTRLEHHGRDLMPDLVSAAQSEMRTLLLAKGLKPENYLTGDTGEWACAWRVLGNMAATGNFPGNTTSGDFQRYCQTKFTEFWGPLVLGTPPNETMQTDPVSDAALPRVPKTTIVFC